MRYFIAAVFGSTFSELYFIKKYDSEKEAWAAVEGVPLEHFAIIGIRA